MIKPTIKLPLPPAHLLEGYDTVGGNLLGIEFYLKTGKEDFNKMKPCLELLGEHPCVLDMGCCTGRIMRFFADHVVQNKWTVHGADIISEYVDWCNHNLKYFKVYYPRELKLNFYDLIYCQSLFTHLPYPEQGTIPILKGCLRDNGLLFATIQDQVSLDRFKEQPDNLFYNYFQQRTGNIKDLVIKDRMIFDEYLGKDCKLLWNRDYFIELVESLGFKFQLTIERAHRNCQVGLLFRKVKNAN